MDRAELHFDLRAVVLGAQGVQGPAGKAAGQAAGEAAPATCNFGLVFAADLWDLYFRALRFLGLIWALDVVEAVDILMRTAFFALCAAHSVEFWMVDEPKPVSLDAMAGGFVAVSYAGVVLYVLERLAGRYRISGEAAAVAENALPMQMVNRERFSSIFSALAVTLVHLAGAAACALTLLHHASELRLERNLWSVAAIATYIVTDVIYAFARLPRFREVAKQSAPSAAAPHIAGAHTLLSLCVGLPFGVLFCVHAVRDEL
jgi:hypothetical protein